MNANNNTPSSDGHLTADWLNKKHWTGKAWQDNKWVSEERKVLYERALHLTLPQLDELSRIVGTRALLTNAPNSKFAHKEDYVFTFDECEGVDIEKIYDYLEQHGV